MYVIAILYHYYMLGYSLQIKSKMWFYAPYNIKLVIHDQLQSTKVLSVNIRLESIMLA